MRARHCVSTRMLHEQDEPDLSLLWQAYSPAGEPDNEIHKIMHGQVCEKHTTGWGGAVCAKALG